MARQIAVRESWLPQRYDMLLRMMRARKIGMWLVVNEEFHDDPLAALIAPPRPYVGRRDIFVFADAGEAGLARVALTGYAEENVQRYFESPGEPAAQGKALAGLVSKYTPASIALAIGGSRSVTRSLTHDAYQFILESIGPEAATTVVPAEPLIEELLDTTPVRRAAALRPAGRVEGVPGGPRAVERGHHARAHHGRRRPALALHAVACRGLRAVVPARPARAAPRLAVVFHPTMLAPEGAPA